MANSRSGRSAAEHRRATGGGVVEGLRAERVAVKLLVAVRSGVLRTPVSHIATMP